MIDLDSPVALAFPVDCAPDDPAFEAAMAWWNTHYRGGGAAGRVLIPDSSLTIGDLDGHHAWRNIHTGGGLETVGLSIDRWQHLVPLPAPNALETHMYHSPGLWWDGRFVVENWVLVDGLTRAQVEAWFRYHEAFPARREGEFVQMGLFVEAVQP